MPRDGSQVYSVPVGTDGVPNTTILSAKYNTFIHDVETDLNTPRPVVAGGTAATSVNGALVNLSAEKAAQIVTNWDSMAWMPGSFYAATTAIGAAPVAAHAFSGIAIINEPLVNPPTNQNVVLEARDLTDPAHMVYYRIMTAGVWGAWLTARQSIYAAPFDALAYNGMQINGSMDVSQENGSTSVSVASGAFKYIVDGWQLSSAGQGMSGAQNSAITPPPGFSRSLGVGPATANASPAPSNYSLLTHPIEGYRFIRLGFGTAAASSVTICFWVRAFSPGMYSGVLANGANSRSYPFTFTIIASNTWEFKTITIPGDTTGTWTQDNTAGAQLIFSIMTGSGRQAPAGAWTSAVCFGATGSFNGVGNVNDAFYLTGVVILPGIEAPSAARSPLIMRTFDQELITCQRYYQKWLAMILGGYSNPGAIYAGWPLVPQTRTGPTVSFASTTYSNASSLVVNSVNATAVRLATTITTTAYGYCITDVILDARL